MEEEPPSPQSAGAYEGREWMTPLTEAKQEEKNLIEAEWRRKMRETFKENRERHSLNCDTQLKLQVAKEFLQVPSTSRTTWISEAVPTRSRRI